jgi:hypothetical protein
MLRQAGQNDEARSEAKAVLKDLAAYPLPSGLKAEDSTLVAEIKAAALEAMGEDLKAAEAFAHRVELQDRSINGELQQGWIDWLRDWWVGHGYARCVARSGRSDAIERGLRDAIAKSSSRGTIPPGKRVERILLAILLEAQGKDALAQAQWQAIMPQPEQQAASLPDVTPAIAPKTGL